MKKGTMLWCFTLNCSSGGQPFFVYHVFCVRGSSLRVIRLEYIENQTKTIKKTMVNITIIADITIFSNKSRFMLPSTITRIPKRIMPIFICVNEYFSNMVLVGLLRKVPFSSLPPKLTHISRSDINKYILDLKTIQNKKQKPNCIFV